MSTAPKTATSRFAPGTFAPAPLRSNTQKLVLSQARMETILFWRHGEQMLLTVVIPLAMLIGLTVIPVLELDDPLKAIFPMVLAISVMSAGFTGQAIAVGFDRRYGALKRIGASGVPPWGIIAGKIVSVCTTVTVQYVLFTAVALVLGADLSIGGWVVAYFGMLLGTFTFTSLGLLMGGTLGAEMILGLANLIWFVLIGAAAYVAIAPNLGGVGAALLNCLPSVALSETLFDALELRLNWTAIVVLILWGIVASALAVRLFRFDMPED